MQEKIKSQLKEAMMAKDAVRVSVIRGLMAAFTNELVAKGIPPQTPIADADALNVIKRAVKQRKDSIEQFTKGNRPELAEKESAELKILESYLPASMSVEDIKKIAVAQKAKLNVVDKAKIGILVGAVMKECKGAADGNDVKKVVEGLFN